MYLSVPKPTNVSRSRYLVRQGGFLRSSTIISKVGYRIITAEIIEGCIHHDRISQRALYEYCYPIMLKVCARYAGTTDDVVEMTNTCFMKVINNLHTLSDIKTLGGWVKQIAVNTSIDLYRSGKNTVNEIGLPSTLNFRLRLIPIPISIIPKAEWIVN